MNTLNDCASNVDLNGTNYKQVEDRFGQIGSAVYLNRTFLNAPYQMYFCGDYSVTAWIKLNENEPYVSIIYFSLGVDNSDALIRLDINNNQFNKKKTEDFRLNEWHFVSFTYKYPLVSIYINGTKIDENISSSPTCTYRSINYVGNNLMIPSEKLSNAFYDDIKIYMGALNSSQIKYFYDYESTNSLPQIQNKLNKYPPELLLLGLDALSN